MFYKVLGLMSGTSLDGLDIAYCTFDIQNNVFNENIDTIKYQILKAVTIPYDEIMKNKILACETCSGERLSEFSSYLGHYFGKQAKKFINENNLTIDFIASHGQTIFHQPSKYFTLQIGDINSIVAESECTVVGDFRSLDVALGGQGAPLVPIGDKILFKDYPCCLNIGGFSNISYDEQGKRIAYDICPSNIVLNYLSQQLSYPYDDGGRIAESSNIDNNLLKELNNICYYVNETKKSLSKEFVKEFVFPILQSYSISYEDKIATYTEHMAVQIGKNIKGDTLITGGGTFNTFLVERIRSHTNYTLIIPDKLTIEYKEALIFAFLGLRRMRKEINCLKEVTGAIKDSCSGVVVYNI